MPFLEAKLEFCAIVWYGLKRQSFVDKFQQQKNRAFELLFEKIKFLEVSLKKIQT